MMEAVRKGQVAAVCCLLDDLGADLALVDEEGVTALGHVAKGRSAKVGAKKAIADALIAAGVAWGGGDAGVVSLGIPL